MTDLYFNENSDIYFDNNTGTYSLINGIPVLLQMIMNSINTPPKDSEILEDVTFNIDDFIGKISTNDQILNDFKNAIIKSIANSTSIYANQLIVETLKLNEEEIAMRIYLYDKKDSELRVVMNSLSGHTLAKIHS